MKRGIRLRLARADEMEVLWDLCLRSKAVWGYGEALLEAFRNELRPNADAIACGSVCVAEVGETVVGLAEVCVESGKAWLEKLFVEPQFIGAGVGGLLMDWAVDRAASQGAVSMVIESDPGAVGFYRSRGAHEDGFVPSGSIPGRMLPRLVLPIGG